MNVDGGGTAELTPAKGKGALTVPAGGSVVLGGKGNASAALNEIGASVKNGNAQKVTFVFSKTGEVNLRAFVVPAKFYFTKWGPTEMPSAPGDTAKPSTEPGGGTGSPTASSPAANTPADTTSPSDASSASTPQSPAAGH